jgi:hypothetical protein
MISITSAALLGVSEIWIDLVNPYRIACNDQDCTNKLWWTNRTRFAFDDTLFQSINVKIMDHGIALESDGSLSGLEKEAIGPYFCTSICKSKFGITALNKS